jgi:tetraacyldisaccharide 4'-kinase
VFRVDNAIHTFTDVGDEPLLLSHYADVFVGKDRNKSALMAESFGYDLLILDDGVTQRYLQPDIKLIVIDSTQGFGNGAMLPLGPNRLCFGMIKHDIDAVIVVKNHAHENIDEIKSKIPESIPIILCHMEQDFSRIRTNERVLAFCGTGYPKKFFNSLKEKIHVVKTVDFPDHYPYSDDDIVDLLDDATIHGAKLVTTQKDMIRISKRFHDFISAVPAKIVWPDSCQIRSYIFSDKTKVVA